MVKIEALTLELAYAEAAKTLECSVTELKIEVVQVPSGGFFGMFKKTAIIVAAVVHKEPKPQMVVESQEPHVIKESPKVVEVEEEPVEKEDASHTMLNDTIMPVSFVSDQDDEDYDLASGLEYTADYDDEFDETEEAETASEDNADINLIAREVESEINRLFSFICFKVEKIVVSIYDKETLLVAFKGDDAALLIGKEGYRYKALSYMIFNWINSKYEVQLRLEIAEFLQNQEESMNRYLTNVCENIDRDGRAQTKILDGILVQIALKELRERYPDKYVAIRSTRDGLKYVLINEYNNY